MTKAAARTTSLGELSGLLGSWRLSLEAANLSPRTIRAYTDDGALLVRFLAAMGMPTVASNIRREHVEAFIAAELERTAPASAATRYRSLQQLFNWLEEEGEITGPDQPRHGHRTPQRPQRPPEPSPRPQPGQAARHVSGRKAHGHIHRQRSHQPAVSLHRPHPNRPVDRGLGLVGPDPRQVPQFVRSGRILH